MIPEIFQKESQEILSEYVDKSSVYYHNINGPRVNQMCHDIVKEAKKEAQATVEQMEKDK